MKKFLLALVLVALMPSVAQAAPQSLTIGGIAVHQPGDSPTSSNRTVNFYEVFTSNFSGIVYSSWLRTEAGPVWDSNIRLTVPTGAQMDLGEEYPSCAPRLNGDTPICNASSWNVPAQFAGRTEYFVYPTNGHITNVRIRLDDAGDGMVAPGNVCTFANTTNSITGALQPSQTNCGWYADAVLHHEMGHALGLAHPSLGANTISPMGAGQFFQSTQMCFYNQTPDLPGHACTVPREDEQALIASVGNHLDPNGPSSAPVGGGTPVGGGSSSTPIDLARIPRDGRFHKINREGGAFRLSGVEYNDARWTRDSQGRRVVHVRFSMPKAHVSSKRSPIGAVPPALREHVRQQRANG